MDFLILVLGRLQSMLDMAFAGALGALVSLPFHADVKTFRHRVIVVGSGAAAAHYVTPLALEFYSLNVGRAGSVSFLIGLFSMSVAAAVTKALMNADLTTVVKAWMPGRGK